MPGYPRGLRAFALTLLFVALPCSSAFAHCFVGARFFPATLATDDPCVADEMSLPTVSWSKTADTPPATQWDVSAELSKRITADFGISIGTTWTQIRGPGGPTCVGRSVSLMPLESLHVWKSQMLARLGAGAGIRRATLDRCVRPLLCRCALFPGHTRHRRSVRG